MYTKQFLETMIDFCEKQAEECSTIKDSTFAAEKLRGYITFMLDLRYQLLTFSVNNKDKFVGESTWLQYIDKYAQIASGCKKVAVGCAIVGIGATLDIPLALTANYSVPNLCKTERGCLRVEKYGDDAKTHRAPADCRAVHSEIAALAAVKRIDVNCVMLITRYPCEACARAIVASGIRKIIYGREQEISAETKEIFSAGGVEVIHNTDTKFEDVLY